MQQGKRIDATGKSKNRNSNKWQTGLRELLHIHSFASILVEYKNPNKDGAKDCRSFIWPWCRENRLYRHSRANRRDTTNHQTGPILPYLYLGLSLVGCEQFLGENQYEFWPRVLVGEKLGRRVNKDWNREKARSATASARSVGSSRSTVIALHRRPSGDKWSCPRNTLCGRGTKSDSNKCNPIRCRCEISLLGQFTQSS